MKNTIIYILLIISVYNFYDFQISKKKNLSLKKKNKLLREIDQYMKKDANFDFSDNFKQNMQQLHQDIFFQPQSVYNANPFLPPQSVNPSYIPKTE